MSGLGRFSCLRMFGSFLWMSMSSLQYDTGPSGFCELRSAASLRSGADSDRDRRCAFVPFLLLRFLPRLR